MAREICGLAEGCARKPVFVFEQSPHSSIQKGSLDAGRAAKPPKHARQSKHQLALNGRTPRHSRKSPQLRRLHSLLHLRAHAMTVSAVRPWRTALQRERRLPSGVVGPVLFSVLRRLASICLREVIENQSE